METTNTCKNCAAKARASSGMQQLFEASPRGGGGGMTWDPPSTQHDERPAAAVVTTQVASQRLVQAAPGGYSGAALLPPGVRAVSAAVRPGTASGPPSAVASARSSLPGHPGAASGYAVAQQPPAAHQLQEFPGGVDDGRRVPCRECGRQFKIDSLDKHIKICRKVFQQKRKQFNSAANRLGDLENAGELIANAARIAGGKAVDSPTKSKAKGGGAAAATARPCRSGIRSPWPSARPSSPPGRTPTTRTRRSRRAPSRRR